MAVAERMITSLQNLRCGINRISVLCLLAVAPAKAAEYSTAVTGQYSFAGEVLPAALADAYSPDAKNYRFVDFGGRIYRRSGPNSYGFSLGLYSAFNARALLTAQSGVSTDFIQRKNAETGGSYLFNAGNYRYGLGWIPLLIHYRLNFWGDLLFADIGAGPAYGFGAAEYSLTLSSGTTSAIETRYHKYDEWGLFTSFTIGAEFKISAGLSIELYTELAFVYAKIRSPLLLTNDRVSVNQPYVRPGLAVAFRF